MVYPRLRLLFKLRAVTDHAHIMMMHSNDPTLQYEHVDDSGNKTWRDVPVVYEGEEDASKEEA